MSKEKIRFLIYIRKSKETSNVSKSVSLVDQFNRIKSKLQTDYNYTLLDDIDSSILDEIQMMKWKIWKEKEELFTKLHKYWLFIENKSAFKAWKRDQFDAMVEFSKKNNFEWFVIWKASRLAKNREDAQRILNFVFDLKERYDFICLDKEYPITIEWKIQLEKDLVDAHKESLEKSRDWKYNYDTTYKTSNKLPNRLPYWYRRFYNEFNIYEIKVDEDAAKIIRKVYDLYDTWVCIWYKNVAKKLNSDWYKKVTYEPIKDINWVHTTWVKTISRNFNHKDVENILNNELYWWYRYVDYNRLTQEERKEFALRYDNIDLTTKKVTIDYSETLRQINWYYPLLLENKNDDWSIARELYNNVQKIRDWQLTFHQKEALADKWKIVFAYKTQNMRCKYCWRWITWENKDKRNDNYRCSCLDESICKAKYKYIWERKIDNQFKENILNKILENDYFQLEKYVNIAMTNLWLYKKNNQNNKENELKAKEIELNTINKKIEEAVLSENLNVTILNTLDSLKTKKENEIKELKNSFLQDSNTKEWNVIDIKVIISKLQDISKNYDTLTKRQKNLVFSNFIDEIKFDWPNKRLDWENIRLSHIVEVLTTNVQYFNKFFNRSPKNYCTWKDGIKKASSDDDARWNLNGKEYRNCTYVYWLRKPVTLLVKLTP